MDVLITAILGKWCFNLSFNQYSGDVHNHRGRPFGFFEGLLVGDARLRRLLLRAGGPGANAIKPFSSSLKQIKLEYSPQEVFRLV